MIVKGRDETLQTRHGSAEEALSFTGYPDRLNGTYEIDHVAKVLQALMAIDLVRGRKVFLKHRPVLRQLIIFDIEGSNYRMPVHLLAILSYIRLVPVGRRVCRNTAADASRSFADKEIDSESRTRTGWGPATKRKGKPNKTVKKTDMGGSSWIYLIQRKEQTR